MQKTLLVGLTSAAILAAIVVYRTEDSASAAMSRPQPNPLKNAYFGDIHVHTKTSFDAWERGNMLTMADAYRFAQGGEVTTAAGEKGRLKKPLDFMALTDHSEHYAAYDLCVEGTGPASQTEACLQPKKMVQQLLERLRKEVQSGSAAPGGNAGGGGGGGPAGGRGPGGGGRPGGGLTGQPGEGSRCPYGDQQLCADATKRVWQYVQKLAADNYKPGIFTTLIGYEYSAPILDANPTGHYHRNVIFGNTTVPDTVFSSNDGSNTRVMELA